MSRLIMRWIYWRHLWRHVGCSGVRWLVNLLMTYQVAGLCKSLAAGWTGVKTFTAVRTKMLGVGRVFGECSGTESTYEFFTCVDAHVRTECGPLVERLDVISTLEWFVARMMTQRNIQVGLRGESLLTGVAWDTLGGLQLRLHWNVFWELLLGRWKLCWCHVVGMSSVMVAYVLSDRQWRR